MFKFVIGFLVVLLSGSMDFRYANDSVYSAHSSIRNDSSVCDSLIVFASRYLHKPYCYGSKVPSCFDCSGFVQFVFDAFGSKVPNSSAQIALQGKFISFKNAVAGDLVFFNGRNSESETVGHVGIVSSCKGDTIHFIHASVQAGVIFSNTKESYYAKRLLFVKRVKLPDSKRKE